MTHLRGRSQRCAVLPPYAASWLFKEISEERWSAAAAAARYVGGEAEARAIEEAYRQVRDAHHDRVSSDGGTSEHAPATPGASSSQSVEWITTREAADMLGESEEMTRRRLREQQLTGRRVGRSWLTPKADVAALAELRRSA